LGLSLAGALLTGAVVVTQTSGVHAGPDREESRQLAARYEETYRSLLADPQPRVTALRAEVDLFPAQRRVRLRGEYDLVNDGEAALERVHIDLDPAVTEITLEFAGAQRSLADPELGMHSFELDSPLEPGATCVLRFELELTDEGFSVRGAEHWLRRNGTFLLAGTGRHPFFRGATIFPGLGYDSTRELTEVGDRRRQGLGIWTGLPRPDASGASARAAGGTSLADVELLVSTCSDQTIVAPGILEKSWEEDGRRFFRFVTPRPIGTLFPIVSARLELVRREWNGIQLELYHHPTHTWNVERILHAMERSLECFERTLGPYPEEALRLVEIPDLGSFACSFPWVMGFVESMAFGAPPHEEGKLDPVMWVVAHEVAHQWWDHQVPAAEAQGSTMVGETLAEYGSLRVLQEEYGEEQTRDTAAHYREVYLRQRSRSTRGERPLVTVEDQDFVHYAKGFVALHALAHRVGAQAIDEALASIVATHANRGAPYVTSIDVLAAVRARIPESMHAFFADWFERIVFLDVGITRATTRKLADGRWALRVELRARKALADEDGHEQEITPADDVELAIFGEGKEDDALQVSSIHVDAATVTFETSVDQRPTHVRLNPELLYLDRNLSDDELGVTPEEY
jgi:hypothetical protein